MSALDLLPLPYRGAFGDVLPEALQDLPLPPRPMPSHHASRPLKAWRYVGMFGPEVMLCVAAVRIGRARQCFWAVWDRVGRRLYERTRRGWGGVSLGPGYVRVRDGAIEFTLELSETAGIETVCRSGASYAWTRKQGGIPAHGMITIHGARHTLNERAVIDDTAAYYERHTSWRWCAGVGRALDGRELAWSLVQGVNDPPRHSERTVWVDGIPVEAPPVRFAGDLSHVDALLFSAEAERRRRDNLLLVRSSYRQPFGTFSGDLPGGAAAVAEGFGVMEEHDARW